jgi:hypoxanthine phosphoribosyltransferase
LKRLLDREEIERGVAALAREVTAEFGDRPITVVGVLTGCVMLVADLVRHLEMPVEIGFVTASSYRGSTASGDLSLKLDDLPDLTGRHVLVVDDIFDSGKTLSAVKQSLLARGPLEVKTAALLIKQGCQVVQERPDFVAFEIPDEFVVGYGLDFRDRYRNLPFVAVLEEDDLREPASLQVPAPHGA